MKYFTGDIIDKAKAYYIEYLSSGEESSLHRAFTCTLPLLDDVYEREFRDFPSDDLHDDMIQTASTKMLIVLGRGVVPYPKYMEFLYTVVKNAMWDAVREHLRGKEPPEDWEPIVKKIRGTKNVEDRDFLLRLPEMVMTHARGYLAKRAISEPYKLATMEACTRILRRRRLSKFHMKGFMRGNMDAMFPINLATVLIRTALYKIRDEEFPLEENMNMDGASVGCLEFDLEEDSYE